MNVSVNVFVTDVGTHEVPAAVLEKARNMAAHLKRPDKALNDRRTLAYRYLRQWANEQDVRAA